ncbi:MAG: pyridoxal 5'-phosphate synthase glutaminase subunit PdxT [Lachnospiraceae bacterium]|nr:pyridoxal 5'-phosphate synthase glutaminase subunit PdxT [Lachnospiraceae bacterium]
MRIGVVAVQGAFLEHEKMLKELGADCVEIRQKKDLEGIDGFIFPGGESTVQGKLLKELDLFDPIQKAIFNGMPVLATCAGLILLAEHLEQDSTTHLQTLPVTVKRNGYGRQLGSFKAYGTVDDMKNVPLVFIRAPYITEVKKEVKILSYYENRIVAVQYKNQIGLSFHPEMTKDTRIHEAFLKLVKSGKN